MKAIKTPPRELNFGRSNSLRNTEAAKHVRLVEFGNQILKQSERKPLNFSFITIRHISGIQRGQIIWGQTSSASVRENRNYLLWLGKHPV